MISDNYDSERALASFTFALRQELDLVKYRKIMSHPMWNYLLQAMGYTRSYEEGLEGGLLLVKFTEENPDKFTSKEYEPNLMKLYGFVLRMLDKLDRWEEYLEVWESIFINTKLELTYVKDARKFHGSQMEPFIIREDANTLYVHFLWGTHYRKALIERKLAKKRMGKRIGNLLHASPAELTGAERKRRVRHIMEIARTINPNFR